MPTIKIADPPPPPCRHPDHSPPSMRVFEPGTYQHTCPKCGASCTFVVEKPRLLRQPSFRVRCGQDTRVVTAGSAWLFPPSLR